jgi:sec-independent protein translocase protein TatC
VSAASTSPSEGSRPSGRAGDDTLDDKRMSFLDHLVELRLRLVRAVQFYLVAFAFCYWKAEVMLGIVTRPLAAAWHKSGLPDVPQLHGALAEPFIVYMRVALYAAIFVASPAIFWQIWAFVAPGLYKRERRVTLAFVTFATVLFSLGAFFAYRVALPMGFQFFFTQHKSIPLTDMRIAPMQMVGEYFDFVLQSLVIFGASFELPLVVLLLGTFGLVDHVQLWKFGRFFILIAFTVGAIFSPPDVLSQVIVSVPLCLLYFFSIALVWLFGTKTPANGKPGPGARRMARASASGS